MFSLSEKVTFHEKRPYAPRGYVESITSHPLGDAGPWGWVFHHDIMRNIFMSARTKWSQSIAAGLASLGLVLAAGCGDSTGLSRRYPVKGTITYKGVPIEKGVVSFVPTDANGRAATGAIVNGKYYLTTAIDGDGVLPGKYGITVKSQEVDLSQAQANASKGGSLRQDDVAKANKNAKNLIPSKYSLTETSGLSKEVKAESTTVDIALPD